MHITLEYLKSLGHDMYIVGQHQQSEEDLLYWAAMPLWNVTKAILLSCNACLGNSVGGKPQEFDPLLGERFIMRGEVVAAHEKAHTFPIVLQPDTSGICMDGEKRFYSMVNPKDFLEWADSVHWQLPTELCQAVARQHGELKLKNQLPADECREVNEHVSKGLLEGYLPVENEPSEGAGDLLPELASNVQKESFGLTDDKVGEKNIVMSKLAKCGHSDRNHAKEKIRNFVRTEMMLQGCTCNHAQMARYVERLSKRDNAGISLKFKRGEITKPVLLDLVKETYYENASDRVINKKIVESTCPVHSIK
jgi:hypothetical protein